MIEAEACALAGGDFTRVLRILRKLSVDEFGELFVSMPNSAYPGLSKILPAMAPPDVQKSWTGRAGMNLYPQTSQFVRALEASYARCNGQTLRDKTILDFGCGYGRLIRMMYYFTDAKNIWGIDAWQHSLDQCSRVALAGNFAKSEDVPNALPTDQVFDVGYAFSVFTHLKDEAAVQCLATIRKSFKPGGLFVGTARPVEFWPFLFNNKKTREEEIKNAERMHIETGYGFLPSASGVHKHYGDSSLSIDFFRDQKGWEFLGYDTLMDDPYQVLIYLTAK
jgi:SAM-dependent methyltransferase